MLYIKKITFIILLLSVSQSVLSEDSDYMDALEAEAEEIVEIQNEKPAVEEKTIKENTKMVADPAPATSKSQFQKRKEFISKLGIELPATMRSFSRLSDDDQKTVIKVYYDNGENMPLATRLIFNLYFKHES